MPQPKDDSNLFVFIIYLKSIFCYLFEFLSLFLKYPPAVYVRFCNRLVANKNKFHLAKMVVR